MALSLVTGPQTDPLTLAEAKLHLRVDVADEDGLIDGLVKAAREHAESFTHRALLTQTWDCILDDFPAWGSAIYLPKAPLISVTSVSYVDQNGTTQPWASSNYTVDAPAGPWARQGRVVPSYNVPYPVTRSVENAVTVRFVAGYGASAASVPASIRHAMKILISTWYGPGRDSVALDRRVELIPNTVDALLWPYKSF